MITKIENALVTRLQKGLGRLVYSVKSYGGELEAEHLGAVRFPLCLVTYGGSRVERMGTNAKRYQSTAQFVVVVAVRSLRSNQAARQDGIDEREIGVNKLIYAVRRLLDSQTLGGLVKPLNPKVVRTLYNQADFKTGAITAYALEYEAIYDDVSPLDDGLFPEPTADKHHPDYVFNQYQGELSDTPMLERINGTLFEPTNGATLPFELELNKEQQNESESGSGG